MAWICDNRIKNGIFSAARPLYVRRSFNINRGGHYKFAEKLNDRE